MAVVMYLLLETISNICYAFKLRLIIELSHFHFCKLKLKTYNESNINIHRMESVNVMFYSFNIPSMYLGTLTSQSCPTLLVAR